MCFLAGESDWWNEEGIRGPHSLSNLGLLAVAVMAFWRLSGARRRRLGPATPAPSRWRPDSTCGTIRQELDRLDASGTQSKVEAASQGKKLAPAAQADVNRYNELLNQYLGARCHV